MIFPRAHVLFQEFATILWNLYVNTEQLIQQEATLPSERTANGVEHSTQDIFFMFGLYATHSTQSATKHTVLLLGHNGSHILCVCGCVIFTRVDVL